MAKQSEQQHQQHQHQPKPQPRAYLLDHFDLSTLNPDVEYGRLHYQRLAQDHAALVLRDWHERFPNGVEFGIKSQAMADLLAVALDSAIEAANTHPDARVRAHIPSLGFPIRKNRVTVTLNPKDRAIVARYIGPDLIEGAALPIGVRVQWFLVDLDLT